MVLYVSLLYHGLKITLVILNVLIALHRERFSSASLSIREYRRMVAVGYMTNHLFHTRLQVKRSLVGPAVTHLIKLVVLGVLVPRVKLQIYAVGSGV